MPDSGFKTYTHKTRMNKNKTDIKIRQKHRYNAIPSLRSIFFPRNFTVVHLFFIKYIEHFQANSKIFAVFFTPCIAIHSRLKRFVMSMQLRQCFARAKPVRLKKKLFENKEKSSALKKARISIKIWLKKAKLATLCFDRFITWFTHLRENK